MSRRKVGVAASASLMKGAAGRNATVPAAATAPAMIRRRDSRLAAHPARFDVPFDMPASPCLWPDSDLVFLRNTFRPRPDDTNYNIIAIKCNRMLKMPNAEFAKKM